MAPGFGTLVFLAAGVLLAAVGMVFLLRLLPRNRQGTEAPVPGPQRAEPLVASPEGAGAVPTFAKEPGGQVGAEGIHESAPQTVEDLAIQPGDVSPAEVPETGASDQAESRDRDLPESIPAENTALPGEEPVPEQPADRPEDQPAHQAEVPAESSRRRRPEKRGGRPREVSRDRVEERRISKPISRRPKPEIVCWERERQWILAVELPDELVDCPSLAVTQNGSGLTQDEQRGKCWRLQEVTGEVSVSFDDGQLSVSLADSRYFLLKLAGQGRGDGRRVQRASYGWYLVVAPEEWQRDDTASGRPPVAPEPVSIPGYQAHFFELRKGGTHKIAFRDPEGSPIEIPRAQLWIDLVGQRVPDADESVGPLFGQGPPSIRASRDTWGNIAKIVVGEEGRGRKRWRTSFTPNPESEEQSLPDGLADRKGGWYFLRVYDRNEDLVESLDFRFLSALRDIKVESPLFPAECGYVPARVRFYHDAECAVEPSQELQQIRITRSAGGTVVTLPPDPRYDETRWRLSAHGGPRVEVTVRVERLWWALGHEDTVPSQWGDRCIELREDDFAATSDRAVWVRLPGRRWTGKIYVGFERAKSRPYSASVSETTVQVPLREFGDCPEVRDHTQTRSLRAWIERDGGCVQGVLAVIKASEPSGIPSTSVPCWTGLGRKKTAVAEAILRRGPRRVRVNDCALDEYFATTPPRAKRFLQRLLGMGQVDAALSNMEVSVSVTGSSPRATRQAKAVAHAVARALMSYDPELGSLVKQAGFGGARVRRSTRARTGGGR